AYATVADLTVLNPLTSAYWAALVEGRQAPAPDRRAGGSLRGRGIRGLGELADPAGRRRQADRQACDQAPRHAGHCPGIKSADRAARAADPGPITCGPARQNPRSYTYRYGSVCRWSAPRKPPLGLPLIRCATRPGQLRRAVPVGPV